MVQRLLSPVGVLKNEIRTPRCSLETHYLRWLSECVQQQQ
jgi:hypothetical protein